MRKLGMANGQSHIDLMGKTLDQDANRLEVESNGFV